MKIEFTIPLTKDLIPSEANRGGEHHMVKHRRRKKQKFLIRAYLNRYIPTPEETPYIFTLTRISSGTLDVHDNLPGCFKPWVDFIADYMIPGLPIGHADSNPRLKWVYAQEKGKPKEYALKAEIVNVEV
jgi:hypothetical protein